jgi:hypothetical protein
MSMSRGVGGESGESGVGWIWAGLAGLLAVHPGGREVVA